VLEKQLIENARKKKSGYLLPSFLLGVIVILLAVVYQGDLFVELLKNLMIN